MEQRQLIRLDSYSIDGTEPIRQEIILYSFNSIDFDYIGIKDKNCFYTIIFLGLPFYGTRN